ncbi:nuclear transport factor 2 family protein [Gaetbulibacter sp. M240]|uniref:nuclear transport factor 2 family protein n=1 Tax=Gaetbulibacter sp. M240 TaxID=3126511 RepID=UPI00374E7147
MKKVSILYMLLFTVAMYSQKKKNGTIYSEHPAINVVEAMQQAFVKGDTATVAGYLADNFRAFDGFNMNPDNEGRSKENFLRQSYWWSQNIDYLSISRAGGAYPDALEYKEDGIWVQTWDVLHGADKITGVKIGGPFHQLYVINKDNKIARVIDYSENIGPEIREARFPRTNGTIYNSHPNIDTVRKMVNALEHGDADKGFSYFSENAWFRTIETPPGERNSVADEKKNFLEMLKIWDIVSIDVVGYPDYLEYEKDATKVVQSWWNFRVKKKSSDKVISIPVLLVHRFNDEGEITSEMGYFTTTAMAD